MSEFCIKTTPSNKTLYRADILYFKEDGDTFSDFKPIHIKDGAIVIENGSICYCGEFTDAAKTIDDRATIVDYSGKLIMPGLIDAHTHSAQLDVIASYGEQLLDWLHNYTFLAEQRFDDLSYANQASAFFLDNCLKAGTTSAAIFCTVHKEATDALFEQASKRNMRIIAGKVMMDRNAPENLTDTAQHSYDDSKDLINKWHNKGRAQYAITPRFAITSTEQQLMAAQALAKEYPDVAVQTHISENHSEIDHTLSLFKWATDYLSVYERFELIRHNSLLGHGIHLSHHELNRIAEHQARIVFCPSSNLFLGSGLLDLAHLEHHNITTGMATDVGAGTRLCMLNTLSSAYQVGQLNHNPLGAMKAFYMATRGNAIALNIADKVGLLEPGYEADFIVLDSNNNDLLMHKQSIASDLHEQLFNLMILGDERAIARTYVNGECLYNRDAST